MLFYSLPRIVTFFPVGGGFGAWPTSVLIFYCVVCVCVHLWLFIYINFLYIFSFLENEETCIVPEEEEEENEAGTDVNKFARSMKSSEDMYSNLLSIPPSVSFSAPDLQSEWVEVRSRKKYTPKDKKDKVSSFCVSEASGEDIFCLLFLIFLHLYLQLINAIS